MNNKKKIAVFGGTFDPIHLGHINLAEAAVSECGLDVLLFVPNYISPFKQDRPVTDGELRCEMIEQVLDLNPAFRVSRYEIGRKCPSRTYDTLSHFREVMENAEISFILGFDSMITIDSWYRGEELLREFPMITVLRPDTDDASGMAKIDEYREKYNAAIRLLRAEPFRASSTEIRLAVKRGEDISAYVTPDIKAFIMEHDLYE